MTLINLLPHREQKRNQRRKDFYVTAGLALIAAIVIVFAIGVVIDSFISNQAERNNFIKAENLKLDDQIKEIASLKQEIEALKARQQAVQDLQSDRNLPVHLLDELTKQVPEGIYLQTIKQDNLKVAMVGMAQSNERVSELLRNLGNNSEWLTAPELIEIKTATAGKDGRRLNQFTVNVSIKRPDAKNDAQGKSTTTSGPAAPAGPGK
jgi:type IV pilus assembly protein PilN